MEREQILKEAEKILYDSRAIPLLMEGSQKLHSEIIAEMKNILRERYCELKKRVEQIYITNDRLRENGVDYSVRSKNIALAILYEQLMSQYIFFGKNLKLFEYWHTPENLKYIKTKGIRNFLLLNGGEVYFYEKTQTNI